MFNNMINKIENKYYLFEFNPNKNKIKKLVSSKNIKKLKEQIIGKSINENNEFILLKLSKEKRFNESNKLIGGPIKITVKIFEFLNNILIPKYEKILNRKGELDPDKRNAQFLFITKEYLDNGINDKDLEKVALMAIKNNLEKRPLAPKLINQIY